MDERRKLHSERCAAERARKRLRLIEMLIERPGIGRREIAREMGYSVSRIKDLIHDTRRTPPTVTVQLRIVRGRGYRLEPVRQAT